MAEIFFSPITGVLSNRPPGTLITGVPGSGKTFTMLNIAAGCLEQDASVFILDAKNDMLALKNIFPSIKVTDVNNIAPGSLDPFLVFKDIDTTIILTIVEILCGSLNETQKLAISPIVGDFVNRARLTGGATFREFAEYLYQNQDVSAQAVGNQLLLNANTKYGGLIFGVAGKKSRGITINNDNRIISIFGMSLPSGSELPKPDELLSSAVVYIICRMMKNIMAIGQNDKHPKVLFLDECHMLMRSNAIKDIIDELLVLGRSLGVSVVMASQNVTHFDEKIAQLVTTKITMRMSKKEATEFFQLFDNTTSTNELDVQECIEICTRLKTGYGFIIDGKERCALVHVTSPYDTGDLTSNPLLKKSNKKVNPLGTLRIGR